MKVFEMFEIGSIMEDENKSKSIDILGGDDCEITSKALNKNKIILHVKRLSDGSEGNVFVRLKEEHAKEFLSSKRLLASKKFIGLTLNQFKELEVDEL